MIDTVYTNGEVTELTRDWFAQDTLGTSGTSAKTSRSIPTASSWAPAGSWLAGVDGGLPGIVMEADPQLVISTARNISSTSQRTYGGGLSLDGEAAVPAGTFTGCVVTKDFFAADERRVIENKWYARDIGLVKSMNVKGGTDISELVSVR